MKYLKYFSSLSLRAQAVAATGSIVLIVLGLNTAINFYSAAEKYREAVIGRTTAIAEDLKSDIDKAMGFGIHLNALDGMSERLQKLSERDKDISHAVITNLDGKVLYASPRSFEGKTLKDAASQKALAASSPMVHTYLDEEGEQYEKVFPLTDTDGRKAGAFRVALHASQVNHPLRSLLAWSLIVAIGSFAIATLLVSWFMQRMITGPLSEMAATAQKMAAGDLSQEVEVRGSSEITDLGGAINTMSYNLRDMLSRIVQMSESLNEALKSMNVATQKMSRGARVQHEAGEQTAMTVNEMLASIKGVAANANEMSQAAGEASSSTTEMAVSVGQVAANAVGLSAAADDTAASIVQTLASIRQVSENTEALSTAAEQTSSSITQMSASVKEVEKKALESARLAMKVAQDSAEQGTAAAREAMQGMEHIRSTVVATADAVNRLGKRSQEIGQILKVIDEVTDQTGLLALNAAILAAQAGEHGKGFAVVAEEIRDLAERTAASTKEIANLIATVQEETAASVLAMGKGLKAVEGGVALVSTTGDVFGQVAASSRQAAEMARAIELTTGEQAKGVAQITEAAVNIAGQIEQIARAMQEQRQGSERIAQSAEKMRDITRQMRTATEEQTSGSRLIASAVGSVTTQAEQVARSTAEQSLGAQQISDAIARIQKITEENVDVSVEMEMAEQTLREKVGALQAELEKFKV